MNDVTPWNPLDDCVLNPCIHEASMIHSCSPGMFRNEYKTAEPCQAVVQVQEDMTAARAEVATQMEGADISDAVSDLASTFDLLGLGAM